MGDVPDNGRDHPRSSDPQRSPSPTAARPGLREALLVGAAVVLAVIAAAGATSLLPADLRDVVVRTPLLIVVLIVGTGGVLWWITRPRHPGSADHAARAAERDDR